MGFILDCGSVQASTRCVVLIAELRLLEGAVHKMSGVDGGYIWGGAF